MKTQKIKNKYIIIVILLCLVATQLLGLTSFAFALDTNNFDNTNIEEDLLSSDKFNGFDYPVNQNGEPELINFVEYGYNFDSSKQENYALYVYIYNPAQLDFSEKDTANSIQIATQNTTDDANLNYKKYKLRYLAKSTDYNQFIKANLFYKFKVIGADEMLKGLVKQERIYNISGVELLTKTAETAKEYLIGGKFKVKGYTAGYGADPGANNTLTQEVTDIHTLKLDVKDTFYRTESGRGKGFQNQVNSVYFGVPNDILNKYGNLQKIKAEYYDYDTMPTIIAHSAMYNTLMPWVGVDIGEYSSDKNCPSLSTNYKFHNPLNQPSYTTHDWTYNQHIHAQNQTALASSYLPLLFEIKKENIGDYTLRSEELKDYIYKYDKSNFSGYLPIKNGQINADMFYPKENHDITTINIDAGDKFNMLGYDASNPWWMKFHDYGLCLFNKPDGLGKDYINVPPIYKVTAEDLIGDFDKKLLIFKDDKLNFSKYFAEQIIKDKSTFLFRFDTSDYYSMPLDQSGGGYMTREKVYFDFDILSLTFQKDGVYMTIPAVSDPIDIISSLTPPPKVYNLLERILRWIKDNFKKFITIVIIIIVAFVAIITVSVWLPALLKLVIWLLKLPIVLVDKMYKSIKNKALEREQSNNISDVMNIRNIEEFERQQDVKARGKPKKTKKPKKPKKPKEPKEPKKPKKQKKTKD